MRVKRLLVMCALASMTVIVHAEPQLDESDQPSLELLEFLAQWSDDNDEIVDIDMLDAEFSEAVEAVDE